MRASRAVIAGLFAALWLVLGCKGVVGPGTRAGDSMTTADAGPSGDGGDGSVGDGGDRVGDPGDGGDGAAGDSVAGDIGAGDGASVEDPLFLDGFFPIGVDVQPASSFDKWQGRGVNTLIRVPQGNDVEDWTAAANQRGLKFVRRPRADPTADIGEENLLAWSHGDEPDLGGPGRIAELQQSYLDLKAIDPDRPVLINFSGGEVKNGRTTDDCNGPGDEGDTTCYPGYIASADWISNDIYPVTGYNKPDMLGWVGLVLDKLVGWSDGRPQFAYIESSDQDLSWTAPETRGVTPDELRAEIWSAIIHGARGIWYFPVAFNPFRFDNTPADVAGEMTAQNARITELADVLQGRINPPELGVTVESPFEATWRVGDRGRWAFVLNLSDQSLSVATMAVAHVTDGALVEVHGEGRELTVHSGELTDDFGPFAVHIYHLL